MAKENEPRVVGILAAGNLKDFIGFAEAADFEAKSHPYDLRAADGRYELAKDVSAFANASGGLLVIGLATTRADDRDLDVVSALALVVPSDVPVSQYEGVIREYVYPVPENLSVEFVRNEDAPAGILAINIPRQQPDLGPFLVCRVVEDGRKLKEIVVGFAQRQGDRVSPISPHALQQRFKKGSDTIAVRLGRIEDKLHTMLDKGGAPPVAAKRDADLLRRRIEDILEPEE